LGKKNKVWNDGMMEECVQTDGNELDMFFL